MSGFVKEMQVKRSVVSQKRKEDLQQLDAIYEISCGVGECPCSSTEIGCNRGFFSLFIQAIYGIAFAEKYKMPYYINFGNSEYLYSDPKRKSKNFWNYYFLQPLQNVPEESVLVPNLLNEVYPLRIWNQQHFIRMNRSAVSKLQFKDDVWKIMENQADVFKQRKILGVQIRRTDHPEEVQPVRLERILKEIDRKIKKHDFLFLATDDRNVVSLLKEKYGSKIIYNEVERSVNEVAVHLNRNIIDRYKLGLEVFLDCFCLSLCENAILTHSNISYAALLFNPHLPYTLLEAPIERYKRIKTLLLYFLDKFGIRKW